MKLIRVLLYDKSTSTINEEAAQRAASFVGTVPLIRSGTTPCTPNDKVIDLYIVFDTST